MPGWRRPGNIPIPAPIDRLFGTLRSAAGVPVQLVLTANPGGPGQHWISERYGLVPFPRKPQLASRTLRSGKRHVAAVIRGVKAHNAAGKALCGWR